MLDTTEIYGKDENWVETGKLPQAMSGLRGSSLNGIMYIFGKHTYGQKAYTYLTIISGGADKDLNIFDNIFRYDDVGGNWESVAKLKQPRHNHAVSVIKIDDIAEDCPNIYDVL